MRVEFTVDSAETLHKVASHTHKLTMSISLSRKHLYVIIHHVSNCFANMLIKLSTEIEDNMNSSVLSKTLI